jgi:hypothetical protein
MGSNRNRAACISSFASVREDISRVKIIDELRRTAITQRLNGIPEAVFPVESVPRNKSGDFLENKEGTLIAADRHELNFISVD